MKIIRKFINWLSGFKKKEFVCELPTTPDLHNINIDIMGPVLTTIAKELAMVPLHGVDFSLNDFHSNIIHSDALLDSLINQNKPVSNIKISYVKNTNKKEMNAIIHLFCLGLDNNVWDFCFDASAIYETDVTTYDSVVLDNLIRYVNGWAKSFKLEVICKHDVYVNDISSFDSTDVEYFSGSITTYKNSDEYDKYAIESDISIENNAKILTKNSTKTDIVNAIKDNSMIVDVVRREYSAKSYSNLNQSYKDISNEEYYLDSDDDVYDSQDNQYYDDDYYYDDSNDEIEKIFDDDINGNITIGNLIDYRKSLRVGRYLQ